MMRFWPRRTEIPLVDRDLSLKQVRFNDLDGLGRTALGHIAPGFAPSTLDREALLRDLEAQGLEDRSLVKFDTTPFRRFAGDSLLPRDRYYTVASEDSGRDDGTLVGELEAYYGPHHAGMVVIMDSTDPWSADLLQRMRPGGPGLLLAVMPIRDIVNPFVARYMRDPGLQTVVIHIPVRVERQRLKDIVDLRDPETAAVFTRAFSRLKWNVDGKRIECFSHRPPLESFEQLLPALLEKHPGGSILTQIAGVWLRKMGAQGLVFPSARVDAGVRVARGRVIQSQGWNFVDYAGTWTTERDALLDVGADWPRHVQLTRPQGHQVPRFVPSVRISFSRSGDDQGSWRAEGIQRSERAIMRFTMAKACIDALKPQTSPQARYVAHEWLDAMFAQAFPFLDDPHPETLSPDRDIDMLGQSSSVLHEALMGTPAKIAEMRAFIETLPHDRLAAALTELLDVAA